MSDAIRFWLNGAVTEVSDRSPQLTLLEWLRYEKGLTGTKEGCAEGDCGACTVMVGELAAPSGETSSPPPPQAGEEINWRAVNACILFMPMLDGRAVITVEGVGTPDNLHPVQQAMVDCHGSQCGFCTPGFVMSLYGRVIGAAGTDAPLEDVLAGNLCRCTGYGPIKAAGESCSSDARDDRELINSLKGLRRTSVLHLIHEEQHWFAPRNVDELAALRLEYPEARIIAGATDVGLWITKKHTQLETVISLTEVADLKTITETEAGLTLGAGVRYVEAHKALADMHPAMGELVRRIGGQQVRNAGTIGGNIANGSPIGDTPPALIALGASLTLRRGDEWRIIALEDFFIAYGQQDLQPGEFVESVFVPRPASDEIIRIDKLSKRFDSDITAVLGAFKLTLKDGVISEARLAFGGMAGTPKRSPHAEAALIGAWSDMAAFEAAAHALAKDFTPMSDARGSSQYRLAAAGNLLRRLGLQACGEPQLSLLEAEAIHG